MQIHRNCPWSKTGTWPEKLFFTFVRTRPVSYQFPPSKKHSGYLSKFFFIVLGFCLSFANAQVLVPTPETAFESQHNFNAMFIKQKGIKKINFEIIDKKDFEVAVNKNLVETYEFNSEGRITRYYYTNIARTVEKHVPVYHKKGRVTFSVVNDYIYDT